MENRGKAGQRKFPWRRLRHLGYRPNRKAESAARKRRGCSFPRQRLCKASSGGQPPRSLNNACDIRAARNEMHRVYRKRRPPSLSRSTSFPRFVATRSSRIDETVFTRRWREEGIIAFLSSNFSRRKISVTIEKATTLYTRAKHTVAQCRSAFRRVRRWNRTVIRMIYTRLERGVLPRGGASTLSSSLLRSTSISSFRSRGVCFAWGWVSSLRGLYTHFLTT